MFCTETIVSSGQCDPWGRIRPDALAALLERVAAQQMVQINEGRGAQAGEVEMRILVDRTIRITEIPQLGQRIKVYIWFGTEVGPLLPRRARILSEDGVVLVETAARWGHLNPDTRTLTTKTILFRSIAEQVEGELPLPSWSLPFPRLERCEERVVLPDQIDENRHMNNACYLTWVQSVLATDFLQTHVLSEVWIEFARELLEGQRVSLLWRLEGNVLWMRGMSPEECFSARLIYREPSN